MTATNRRLKVATITLGGTDFSCQITEFQVINNTPDGARVFTYCPTGEFREEVDPDYALMLKGRSDWTASGWNRWMITNNGATVAFVVQNHTDLAGTESVQYSGTLVVKAPTVGGKTRDPEESDVTWNIIGTPVITYP